MGPEGDGAYVKQRMGLVGSGHSFIGRSLAGSGGVGRSLAGSGTCEPPVSIVVVLLLSVFRFLVNASATAEPSPRKAGAGA